jgi:outer membrane protein assembly factor BamB
MSKIIRACPFLIALMSGASSDIHAGDDNWPRFRGPTGQGLAPDAKPPLRWSAEENVAWKTPIPGEGWSSPIVLGNRVFVTCATDGGKSCHVLALDRATGKILWDTEAFQQVIRRKQAHNSFATPTPVTDGELLYATFCDGTVVALTLAGEVRWTNREVKYYGEHGLASSPVLYQDLLIQTYDGSNPGADRELGWRKPWDQSFLLALEKKTGKVRWTARRGESRIAHVTPLVVPVHGRDVLVSNAGDVIQGFDPKTGERLWSLRSEGQGVIPSPVGGDGLVFTTSGYEGVVPAIRAVRLTEKGAELAWEQPRNVPMMPSMLYIKPYLFTLTEKGNVQCLEAASGKIVWQQRPNGTFAASPVLADGKIYILSDQGETTVLEAKPEFKVLVRNPLHETCQASPAFVGGDVFIRAESNLYCIRAK